MSEFHDASLPHFDEGAKPTATPAKESKLSVVLDGADEAFERVNSKTADQKG